MSQKIVYMGTPDFAVESLKAIIESGIEVAAVITAPDRKSGRGQKVSESAVKQYAKSQELKILQPEKLKDEHFIQELKSIDADLFVVVAFRMLPEVIWNMPSRGTINLHGSLLPQYRGAAPINWAVMNGESETGATTFFIEKEIDTGRIIDNVKIDICKEDSAGTVHDKLMLEGAQLLSKTVERILEGDVESKAQAEFDVSELKDAPKIFKPDCKINWETDTLYIYNKIRGLSPHPTAWTEIESSNAKKGLKLFQSKMEINDQNNCGKIKVEVDRIAFGTNDGWIYPEQIQLEGKKRMLITEFIKGFDFTEWNLLLN